MRFVERLAYLQAKQVTRAGQGCYSRRIRGHTAEVAEAEVKAKTVKRAA
jgi:hypothetical protein